MNTNTRSKNPPYLQIFILLVLAFAISAQQGCSTPASQEKSTEKASEACSGECGVTPEKPTSQDASGEITPEGSGETTPEKTEEVAPEPLPRGDKKLGMNCKYDHECLPKLICKDPGLLGVKKCTRLCDFEKKPCPGIEICEQHSDGPGYCVPGCKTHADCKDFEKIPVCNIEKHCWTRWIPTGVDCEESIPCITKICRKVEDFHTKLCTRTCKDSDDCGATGYCKIPAGKTEGSCLMACKDDQECDRKAPITPKCVDKKYCWGVGN